MAATTTSAGHKNTKQTQGPTGSVIKGEKATCTAEGIKAFCEHTGEKDEKGAEGKGAEGKGAAGGNAAHLKTAPPTKAAPAKPAPPKTAPPAAASKPGGAAPPEDGRRFAKEEVEAPPPAHVRPGQPPPKPITTLVLELVPTAADDDEDNDDEIKKGTTVKVSGVKGLPDATLRRNSTEVGLVKHIKGIPGKGDVVTILANKKGTASPCPKWTITDHGTGQSAANPEHKSGTPLKHTFMPPTAVELRQHIIQNPFFQMGWLDVVKPRHYTVVCTSPFPAPPPSHVPVTHHPQAHAAHPRPAPGAHHPLTHAPHKAPPPAAGEHQPPGEHHTLAVYVYPSDKWTLKLGDDKSEHKPAWLKALDDLKEEFEAFIHHASELANTRNPLIPIATIKLMEGELSLSNFWEEEEGSNMVRWTAELEGKVTFIDLTLSFGIDAGRFIKAAENLTEVTKVTGKAIKKFEEHFQAIANVKAEASLSFVITIKIVVGGKAIWNKGEHSPLTANVKDLKIDVIGGLGLSGELTVERIGAVKTEVLVKFTGIGTSEMTLSTSPRLESGGNLWLDNTFAWNPLKVNLTAEANKADIPKKGSLPVKPGAAPPASEPEKPIPILPSVDYEWSGELFTEVKGSLKSLNLTTRTWGPPHALQNPITATPHPAPHLTPAVKPSKPVAVP